MGYCINKVLVISTSHVSGTTAEKFDTLEPGCDVAPAFMKWEYGWQLWTQDDDAEQYVDLYPEIPALMRLANQLGCQWLRLDCDGDVIEGFPTFKW